MNVAPESTQAVMKLTMTAMMSEKAAPVRMVSSVWPTAFIQYLPKTGLAYQIEPTTMLDAVASNTAQ
jgi:hypothetical protein